jgi:hypothetical protein
VKIENGRLVGIGLAIALASALPAAAQGVGRGLQSRIQVSYGDGESLYVQVTADGRPPMPFERDSYGTWTFRGDTASLVGRSYTVRLENTGRSRIKVVVGVDGVNVYFRKPIAGAADGDIGSILGPGQTRVLTGFQADEQTAQRFVFSPPEFSEGAQGRGARIGEIDVHVYQESLRASGRSIQDQAPGARPNIGTTAGEDVDSEIRRVSFVASTREPVARVLLTYGRPETNREPIDEPTRGLGPLAIEIEQQRDGLRVVRVERDGLGDDIGLREGDVITKIDTFVRPTMQLFRRTLRDKRRGTYLFLEVLRSRGHVVNFKVRM